MGKVIYDCRAAALLILFSALSPSRSYSADTDAVVQVFLETADTAGRQAAIEAICAASCDPLAVEQLLHRGRKYSADVKKGWQVFNHIGGDRKERPYHVYVPNGYDAARKHSVIVMLHGSAALPDLPAGARLDTLREGLSDESDKHGWLIVLPLGQGGASWFDRIGIGNVLAQLAAVKRRYNVDEERVFVGGHSDGGNGGFIMGLFHPTPWAGLFALSSGVDAAIHVARRRLPGQSFQSADPRREWRR